MDDESLKTTLRKLEIPTPDPAARERALHRAMTALANAGHEPIHVESPRSFGFPRWAFAFCLLAVVALLASVMHPHHRNESSVATANTILDQFERTFPGQLDAVIEDNGKVDIELADQPSARSDQPLMVTLVRGSHVVRVLSYSGRRVCLEMSGSKVCFEALLTADGRVILAGDTFVWSSQQPEPLAGYAVKATPLNPAS